MTKKKPNFITRVIVAIGLVELVGGIGGFFTASSVKTWYGALRKPALNPPSWIFGPVWTTLFALMGIAVFLVWNRMGMNVSEKRYDKRHVRGALSVFGAQMILNVIWSVLFFGLRAPGWAFFELILLWIVIVATIFVFSRISKAAAWLLVPYILWVSFAGYLNYSLWKLNKGIVVAQQPQYCTQEAKVCDDGSTVARTGPNCEFAACPEPAIDPSWKISTDEQRGISFRYPETLGTIYMRAYDWPPKVAVTNGPFECLAAGSEIERAGRTEPRTVNGRTYCVTKESEGAAGSIYTQYAYAVDRGDTVLIFTATVRATQCANYDDTHRIQCEQERAAFDLDTLMDKIIQTVAIH